MIMYRFYLSNEYPIISIVGEFMHVLPNLSIPEGIGLHQPIETISIPTEPAATKPVLKGIVIRDDDDRDEGGLGFKPDLNNEDEMDTDDEDLFIDYDEDYADDDEGMDIQYTSDKNEGLHVESNAPFTVGFFSTDNAFHACVTRIFSNLNIKVVDINADKVDLDRGTGTISAVIFTAGENEMETLDIPQNLMNLEIPTLAIGYGLQIFNLILGGDVETVDPFPKAVICKKTVAFDTNCSLFDNFDNDRIECELPVDLDITRLGDDLVTIARDGDRIAGIMNKRRRFYAVGFNPASSEFKMGSTLIQNFLTIIGAKQIYSVEYRSEKLCKEISLKTADVGKTAIVVVGAGVKSAFLCKMVQKGLPGYDNIRYVHIVTGFSDSAEDASVIERLANEFNIEIETINKKMLFRDFKADMTVKKYQQQQFKTTSGFTLNTINEMGLKMSMIGDAFITSLVHYLDDVKLNKKDVVFILGNSKNDFEYPVHWAVTEACHEAHISSCIRKAPTNYMLKESGLLFPLSELYREDMVNHFDGTASSTWISKIKHLAPTGYANRIICSYGTRYGVLRTEQTFVNLILDYHSHVLQHAGLARNLTFKMTLQQYHMIAAIGGDDMKGIVLPFLNGKRMVDKNVLILFSKYNADWVKINKLWPVLSVCVPEVYKIIYCYDSFPDNLMKVSIKTATRTGITPTSIGIMRKANKCVRNIIQAADISPDLKNSIIDFEVTMLPIQITPFLTKDPFDKFQPVLPMKNCLVFRLIKERVCNRAIPIMPKTVEIQKLCNTIRLELQKIPNIDRVLIDLSTGYLDWE